MSDIEEIIPHSVEAEQSVLGAILLDEHAIDKVSHLKPEHFYLGAHREIFKVIARMSADSKRIDVITLAEEIGDAGLAEQTGGLYYLGEMVSNTPSAANVKRYADVVMNKATERQLLAAAGDIMALVRSSGATRDKVAKAQEVIMGITESRQQKAPKLLRDLMHNFMETLEQRSKGIMSGIPTGIDTLDEQLGGGLQDGNLIVVAGRPSMGKSAFTSTIGINVALGGDTVGLLSMEMTNDEQAERSVAQLGRVSLAEIRRGNLKGDIGERIQTGMGRALDIPLVIDDEGGLSVGEVISKARQIKRLYGLKMLIVDALGLMEHDADKAVSQLGAITRTLKAFAKEMNIPVVLLCQLSRKCEDRTDKRPILSDLRDSGAIEQDADVVIMLYRDEYYNPDSRDKGIAEALVRKARQGKIGVVPMAFIGEQTRFEALGREWEPPEPTKPMTRSRGGMRDA